MRGNRLRRSSLATAGLATIALLTTGLAPAMADPIDYRDPTAPIPERVDDLMSRMSLDDKLGQMVQVERVAAPPEEAAKHRVGSVLSGGGSAPEPNTPEAWADMYDAYQRAALDTPLGIPLIYGVDAVHGHNNVQGATIYPHNIGLGAAGDPDLVQRISAATAEEVAATGIDWDFAPCLCVARDDRWGRTYESFGETPEQVTAMASAVTGLQGEQLGGSPTSVLATAKHYIGDGGTTGGDDQGNAELSEQELRDVHLPPFQAAIDRGVGSVMVSYSSWNDVKLHANRYLVTDVLKDELGFDGLVVSDYDAIDKIDGQEEEFTRDEVRDSVNAGLDMIMMSENHELFLEYLRAEVDSGQVPMERIDDANRRVLTKKFELGLFENPFAQRDLLPSVGSAEHRELAREAVRESQVLLKNDGVLPLSKDGGKLFVAGKNADDIGNQTGGWTITWQGSSGDITEGTTILDGIRQAAPDTEVTYSRDGEGIDDSYGAAVVVVGETPYAEYEGDRPEDLKLDDEDLATIAKLRESGVPVVVVTVSGRPLDIGGEVEGWNALLASWLPGTEGQGVADVLFGDHAPSGKLPMTWMGSFDQQPINAGDGQQPLFPLGFGLTY
ncbi:glycoside hydrolase family 3 N-terminal domain-containing protein [Saccharopolyspora gloriosae]|uniref:beta-glucosidase n=1 Tax=Saccharopolyspora gloriosae TaxID=455344 RepID=A0A840NH55_9PSEU|nr:beta-glucosidase [Saccharopolyspora gloriosae]